MRLRGVFHGLMQRFLQHSVQHFSGIMKRSSGYIIRYASCLMTKYTRVLNVRRRSLPKQHPSFTAQSPSIHTRSIIHHPNLHKQVLYALFELQMRLVLLYIILPVLLTGKLYHKGMRITCLPACQLAGKSISRMITQERRLHRGRTDNTLLFSGLLCRPPVHAVM